MDEERREAVPKAILSYSTFAIIHLCLPSFTFDIFLLYVLSFSFILKSSFIFHYQNVHYECVDFFKLAFAIDEVSSTYILCQKMKSQGTVQSDYFSHFPNP